MSHRPMICALLICFLASGVAVADSLFPKTMRFKVSKGIASGNFDLNFGEELGETPRYVVTLRNFGGFGVTSEQQLWSQIFQKDLSLYGHMVTENEDTKNPIRSVFLNTNCKSAMGQDKTTCFLYKGQEQGEAIQTEIFTPYRAIDLVSSIVVATHEASKRSSSAANFNFIFEKRTRQVTLEREGTEHIDTTFGRREAVILSLKFEGTDFELYRFYIAQGPGGFFPAKLVFDSGGESAELIAENAIW